jgi:hypothetical protein
VAPAAENDRAYPIMNSQTSSNSDARASGRITQGAAETREAHGLDIHKIVRYAAPATDGVAAFWSTAASRLYAHPVPDHIAGAVSGVLWAVGAGIGEVSNTSRNLIVSTANGFAASAGVLTASASLVSRDSPFLGFATAGSWAANSIAIGVQAIRTEDNVATRVLIAFSGLANFTAALLSAKSVQASRENDEAMSVSLATASSLVWAVGSTAGLCAAWMHVPVQVQGHHTAELGNTLELSPRISVAGIDAAQTPVPFDRPMTAPADLKAHSGSSRQLLPNSATGNLEPLNKTEYWSALKSSSRSQAVTQDDASGSLKPRSRTRSRTI